LAAIGECKYNCRVTDEDLLESLKYYNEAFGA
jgi:hypothetical protein